MIISDPQALDEQFAIAEHIRFTSSPSGLALAEIRNSHAAATIAIQGGHVVALQPHGQEPVLWASRLSAYEPGKSIRGGIPVCWPWFGAHPSNPRMPAHGFVRKMLWQVSGTSVGPADATQVRLRLEDNATSQELWPHVFEIEVDVTIGRRLHVDLIIRNPDDRPFTCTGALHSYFNVGDARQIRIHGLDDTDYLDKVEGFLRKHQQGPVTIEAETDRVYVDTTSTCVIEDPVLRRRIVIEKAGSRTTVVWNPWAERAREIPDFADDEYLSMVCVETANADKDVTTIAPGGEHRLRAVIGLET